MYIHMCSQSSEIREDLKINLPKFYKIDKYTNWYKYWRIQVFLDQSSEIQEYSNHTWSPDGWIILLNNIFWLKQINLLTDSSFYSTMKINSLNTRVIYVSNMLRSSIDCVLNISAAQIELSWANAINQSLKQ